MDKGKKGDALFLFDTFMWIIIMLDKALFRC